ncbi:ABC transporter ATP-binding protein [Paenibacillus thiaminolyticus]|uniref:ABC transporter ATP-binding protein n=1 Tax=Paenibacillus thiaminolyticus TaxID=49283 RepID=A0AAP9J3R0_PANTH|nr:ABC transporter ATP-binding protein [Paenibacillus thiaminolyticus]MCY9538987.1 ABC transporter ATP-binding protein [Paenibacillus thiaminolyticus]MCY9604227.1 ABC transporter ATP-binding protein [Paenibacillus thiaminolyticus]MCY9608098.1 ABC transporter ATP-binding protein [Paenibacillus thiaminolyticus]MCY9612937.1 ABC transporter ATP-binding protein [Paenibacillus thiaminolyticus]MCY9622009.1 ABC transporter ATP-binding protein [Paenibacillus thiaminolyticus]
MKRMIIGDRIVKSFGEGDEKRNVLDGVSVEINEGEFVAVMGPSGSGKSTLMFALSGTDSVNGGKVVVDGRDISEIGENELSDIRRTKMGFVFQQPTMLKNLNILDNIILPSMRGNRKHAAKITEKARALMKRVGIAELEKRDITQVSGGQLQRAGICRALMNSPRIIFGDEPTGALNSQSAQEIMDLFSEINAEGTAVMLVTHDVKVAARTERIMFMRDGTIVSDLQLPKFDGTNMDGRIEKVTVKMREIGI